MPYMQLRTSKALTPETEKELKAALGQAVTLFPGKTETWLMVDIEDEAHLWLGGKCDKPLAIVNVALLGKTTKEACAAVTACICKALADIASIPSDGVYVKYQECALWGYDGVMF